MSRYNHPLPLHPLIRSILHGISSNAKACLCFQGLFAFHLVGQLSEVEKLNGRDRFTRPHAPPDRSPQQDLQVEKQDPQNVIDRLLNLPPARIIANQPLRAKEASPLISKEYPIIVTMRYPRSCNSLNLLLRTMNTMQWLWVPVAQVSELRLALLRQGSTQHVYRNYFQREVTRSPRRAV